MKIRPRHLPHILEHLLFLGVQLLCCSGFCQIVWEKRSRQGQQNHSANSQKGCNGTASRCERIHIPIADSGQSNGREPERCRNTFETITWYSSLFATIRFHKIEQTCRDNDQERQYCQNGQSTTIKHLREHGSGQLPWTCWRGMSSNLQDP